MKRTYFAKNSGESATIFEADALSTKEIYQRCLAGVVPSVVSVVEYTSNRVKSVEEMLEQTEQIEDMSDFLANRKYGNTKEEVQEVKQENTKE